MSPLFQFMHDTGWIVLVYLVALRVFLNSYWAPRVLIPAFKVLQAMPKDGPGRFRTQIACSILTMPLFVVWVPLIEELLFRAPLFIWGPFLSEPATWRLFVVLNVAFVATHPQYYYTPIGQALAAAELEAERRTATPEEARVILSSVRREKLTSAVVYAILHIAQIWTFGYMAWRVQSWSGSYWGAVLAHTIFNLGIVQAVVVIVLSVIGILIVLVPEMIRSEIRLRRTYRRIHKSRWLPRFLRKKMW